MIQSRLAYFDGALTQLGAHTIKHGRIIARWEGLLYVDGFRAQEESVRFWLERVTLDGLNESLPLLKGAFFMLLEMDGSTHVFVDNSGMYAAYWSRRGASQSYLALVDAIGLGWKDLDDQALVEFLQTGNIYSCRTHFLDINKIRYDERLEYRADGDVKRHIKLIPFIDSPTEHPSLIESFKGYAYAISNLSTSVDVTGGLDTRTVVAALHAQGVDFETSVSGHLNHPDVQLGSQVARSVDRQFHVSTHNISDLQSQLKSVVESLDGLRSHILPQHRLRGFQRERYDRGVTLTLKGLGGELYRDYIWLQDFPRYGSKNVDLSRMHRMRMEMVRLPEELLTPNYRLAGQKAREERIIRLQQYRRDTNTQSYDVAHCCEFLQVSGSRQLGSWVSDGNIAQAPLTELFRLQHAYHQPLSQRFAGRYQKRFITDCSLELAKVPTTYGTRATSRASDIPGDVLGLTSTYSKTLIRKLGQRYFNKTPFAIMPADDPKAWELFANSSFTQEMLNILSMRGVLKPGVTAQDIPNRFLSNFVSAGHFLSLL